MASKRGTSFKRCQECSAVNQASAFKRAAGAAIVGPERRVVCPACGYTAPAWAFVPVEQPAEQEEQD